MTQSSKHRRCPLVVIPPIPAWVLAPCCVLLVGAAPAAEAVKARSALHRGIRRCRRPVLAGCRALSTQNHTPTTAGAACRETKISNSKRTLLRNYPDPEYGGSIQMETLRELAKTGSAFLASRDRESLAEKCARRFREVRSQHAASAPSCDEEPDLDHLEEAGFPQPLRGAAETDSEQDHEATLKAGLVRALEAEVDAVVERGKRGRQLHRWTPFAPLSLTGAHQHRRGMCYMTRHGAEPHVRVPLDMVTPSEYGSGGAIQQPLDGCNSFVRAPSNGYGYLRHGGASAADAACTVGNHSRHSQLLRRASHTHATASQKHRGFFATPVPLSGSLDEQSQQLSIHSGLSGNQNFAARLERSAVMDPQSTSTMSISPEATRAGVDDLLHAVLSLSRWGRFYIDGDNGSGEGEHMSKREQRREANLNRRVPDMQTYMRAYEGLLARAIEAGPLNALASRVGAPRTRTSEWFLGDKVIPEWSSAAGGLGAPPSLSLPASAESDTGVHVDVAEQAAALRRAEPLEAAALTGEGSAPRLVIDSSPETVAAFVRIMQADPVLALTEANGDPHSPADRDNRRHARAAFARLEERKHGRLGKEYFWLWSRYLVPLESHGLDFPSDQDLRRYTLTVKGARAPLEAGMTLEFRTNTLRVATAMQFAAFGINMRAAALLRGVSE